MKSRISKLQDHNVSRPIPQVLFSQHVAVVLCLCVCVICFVPWNTARQRGDKQKTQKNDKNGSRATTAPGGGIFFNWSWVAYGGIKSPLGLLGEIWLTRIENFKREWCSWRIDANVWMLNQELNIPYITIVLHIHRHVTVILSCYSISKWCLTTCLDMKLRSLK